MSGNSKSHENKDDFRKIKGIGEVTEKVLNELGIQTYQDLANQTPTKLEALLKGKISDLTLHHIRKDDWNGQAKALMDKSKTQPTKPQIEPNSRETWRELADFFISFGYSIDGSGKEHLQTKAHHSQADKLQKWEGIATEKLSAWILKQANLPETPRAQSSTRRESMTLEGEQVIRMTLADVWVEQTGASQDPLSGQMEGFLRVETQLTLLDDLPADVSNENIPYSIEFYLIDTQTNQSRLVDAFSDFLSPGAQSYLISQDITIPEAGRYQLILFARLLPPLIGIAQAQGPLIRVEA